MSHRPKSQSRRLGWDVALWVFIIAVPFLNGGLAYLEGYKGGPFMLLMLPMQLFALLAALGCLLVLLVRFVLDLVAHRSPWSGAVLLSSFAGLILLVVLLPGFSVWFLAGLADGFERHISRPEVMKIAETARECLPNESVYWSPSKRLSPPNPDEAEIESRLQQAPIAKLPGAFTIANHNEVVEIEWGGALVGHWGLRIAPGKVSVTPYDYAFRRIDDRLAAYYTD